MKKILLFALLLISTAAFSQKTKDERAVADAIERLRQAMVDGNGDVLASLAADSISYGHSSGHIEGKKDFVGNIASGKSDFVTIDLSNQTISIVDNIAIVRHTLNATTNDSGKPGAVKLHVLYVWKKTKGEWLLVARQAVKLVS